MIILLYKKYSAMYYELIPFLNLYVPYIAMIIPFKKS